MIRPPQTLTASSDRELRTELEETQGELKRARAEAEALRTALEASQAEVERQRGLLPANDEVAPLEAAVRSSTAEAERLQREIARVEAELARATETRGLTDTKPDPGLIRSVAQSQEEIRALQRRLGAQPQTGLGLRGPALFLGGFVMVAVALILVLNGAGSGDDLFWCGGVVVAGSLIALWAGSSDGRA